MNAGEAAMVNDAVIQVKIDTNNDVYETATSA